MRALLLTIVALCGGCATTAPPMPADGPTAWSTTSLANGAASQSTSVGRTQTVGLPLSRGGKIGLWTGVGVVLAYLMATDGEDGEAPPAAPRTR